MDDVKAIAAIAGGAAAHAGAGAIVVAEIVGPAPGILGAIGLTTTTTVALPVAGVVAVAGLVGYGVCRGVQWARNNS